MLGFNVSDTMKSIRMLLNKHTRNMDLSAAQPVVDRFLSNPN